MAINFKVIERGQPGVPGGGEKKFYASAVMAGELSLAELTKAIEKKKLLKKCWTQQSSKRNSSPVFLRREIFSLRREFQTDGHRIGNGWARKKIKTWDEISCNL